MWLQILWVETQPASHGWTGRAKALRDRLLGAAAGVLGALNSRNCRRPFAPAAAFQTEDLPAGALPRGGQGGGRVPRRPDGGAAHARLGRPHVRGPHASWLAGLHSITGHAVDPALLSGLA